MMSYVGPEPPYSLLLESYLAFNNGNMEHNKQFKWTREVPPQMILLGGKLLWTLKVHSTVCLKRHLL